MGHLFERMAWLMTLHLQGTLFTHLQLYSFPHGTETSPHYNGMKVCITPVQSLAANPWDTCQLQHDLLTQAESTPLTKMRLFPVFEDKWVTVAPPRPIPNTFVSTSTEDEQQMFAIGQNFTSSVRCESQDCHGSWNSR